MCYPCLFFARVHRLTKFQMDTINRLLKKQPSKRQKRLQDITDDINPDGVNEITSFGIDPNGEMLVIDRGGNDSEGVVYRIEAE